MDDSGYMFNESIIILHSYQPVIFHHHNVVFVGDRALFTKQKRSCTFFLFFLVPDPSQTSHTEALLNARNHTSFADRAAVNESPLTG